MPDGDAEQAIVLRKDHAVLIDLELMASEIRFQIGGNERILGILVCVDILVPPSVHGHGAGVVRFPEEERMPFEIQHELRRRGIDDPKGPFNEDVYDAARTLARKTLRDRETEMADYEEKTPQWFSPSVFPGTLSPALDEQLAGFYLLELARLCGNPSAYDEVVRTVFRNTEELRGSFSPRNTQGEAA